MPYLLIEAESFQEKGGWVVDTQSVPQMGSAYLMAHGLGTPVKNAETEVMLPEAADWHAWVRTRNWSAEWGRGSAAGIFRLLADGNSYTETLGNKSKEWEWQYAGVMHLDAGTHKVALQDMTGFNGRCDCIYFTTEAGDIPQNTESYREQRAGVSVQEDDRYYDLVICGGGIAGTAMALTAIREGLKVALIQDRGMLGGCNSSEIKVGLGGYLHAEPYPNIGNVVEQISPVFNSPGAYPDEYYEDARKLKAFETVPAPYKGNYKLALNQRMIQAESRNGMITAVIAKDMRDGSLYRYKGALFADCTGDAVLARKMGASVMYGREASDQFGESLAPEKADRMVMGMTTPWFTTDEAEEVTFPDIDWGIEINEKNGYLVSDGDWEWEFGQFRDMADETEKIRDYGLMTVFANWSYVKNHSVKAESWKNKKLAWASPFGGKRESYRVCGEYILTQRDIEEKIPHPDGTASMTWDIDLHYPELENMRRFEEPFRSCAIHRGIERHYPVPYRCLYAKDVPNLFLGGRCISTTHVAFSCVRVMRTLGALGEVVGMAAAVCRSKNILPGDVVCEWNFAELRKKMERGVQIQEMHAYPAGKYEKFAFREIWELFTDPEITLPLERADIMEKINSLGIPYRGYERFQGIENRTLTAEEKEIVKNRNDSIIKIKEWN